jgi:hypothetical protein
VLDTTLTQTGSNLTLSSLAIFVMGLEIMDYRDTQEIQENSLKA